MIVAGFGFTSRATADSLRDAFAKVTEGRAAPARMATLKGKAGDACFEQFRRFIGLELVAISTEQAQTMDTVTQSAPSAATHGVGSVAEATALAAAGPGAVLIASRVVSGDRQATCALARGGTG